MRAFITFESEEGFLRCMKAFPSSSLSTYFYSDNIEIDGVTLTVSQANVRTLSLMYSIRNSYA